MGTKLYLPNSPQFDLMNEILARIAEVIEATPTTPGEIGAATPAQVSAAIAEAVAPLATTAALNAAIAPLAKANLSNASGTFGGAVKANASAVSVLGTAQVRNVTISATDLTAGSSALATGDSYRVYS